MLRGKEKRRVPESRTRRPAQVEARTPPMVPMAVSSALEHEEFDPFSDLLRRAASGMGA